MERQPCVYILTNRRNGTLYIGVTSHLQRRVWEHKSRIVEGFTKKYSLDKLVWYEVCDSMLVAIGREKSMKYWKRKWKLEVIERLNPHWRDLYYDLN